MWLLLANGKSGTKRKQKVMWIIYKPSKIALPIGKYAISINGQFQQVEIKEGEVTKF